MSACATGERVCTDAPRSLAETPSGVRPVAPALTRQRVLATRNLWSIDDL